uniref:Uncharacterized protein n=1 Tax=Molossus molossus TaxID=27622 RepID=A0A7J8GKS7_MOLMO|nr:hypothetical protein HJG59_011444 [Molossus molossus]
MARGCQAFAGPNRGYRNPRAAAQGRQKLQQRRSDGLYTQPQQLRMSVRAGLTSLPLRLTWESGWTPLAPPQRLRAAEGGALPLRTQPKGDATLWAGPRAILRKILGVGAAVGESETIATQNLRCV